LLSVLRADEKAIELRKQNIQRFGAGWLKPPGVSKTLQGMQDEELERREQEANGLRYVDDAGWAVLYTYALTIHTKVRCNSRELEALDAQARLLEEQAGDADVAILGDDESEQERDLDDDIPDADEGHGWVDEDEEDGLPGDEGDGDYADDQGIEGMETRDLDDDVPEAGSYQHTDTEAEDESSDIEPGTGGRESLPAAMGVVSNAGMAHVSSVLGSSSPVAQRGGRRSGGGLGRGRGREN